MKILVSIPTCNSERFIGGCLDSVFAQTVRDFEIIVSDNGSMDRTGEILRSYRDIAEPAQVLDETYRCFAAQAGGSSGASQVVPGGER